MSERIEPVGNKEIALMLGVSNDCVLKWISRSSEGLIEPPFPPSRGKVSGLDARDKPEVQAWYEVFKSRRWKKAAA